jgi:hypothetical protein
LLAAGVAVLEMEVQAAEVEEVQRIMPLLPQMIQVLMVRTLLFKVPHKETALAAAEQKAVTAMVRVTKPNTVEAVGAEAVTGRLVLGWMVVVLFMEQAEEAVAQAVIMVLVMMVVLAEHGDGTPLVEEERLARKVVVAAELMDSLERPVSLVLAMAEAEGAVPMVAE